MGCVCVGGRNLNNLRYADDTTLLADSEGKLQRLLDVVARESDNVSPTQLIRATEDRLLWHNMVANVDNDDTAP